MHLVWCALSIYAAVAGGGEIAFVANAGAPDGRVCILDIASNAVTPVGPGVSDGAPVWSPDGAWIAMESGDVDARGIYVVRPDGTEGRMLSHGQPWNVTPRWSTDGTRLTYSAASGAGGLGRITVYDMNSNEEQIWGGSNAGFYRPVWMPYTQLMWALDPEAPETVPGVDMNRFLSEAHMSRLSILSGALPDAVLAIQIAPGASGRKGVWTRPVLLTKSEVLPILSVAESSYEDRGAVVWNVEPSWEDGAFDFTSSTGRKFGPYEFADRGEAERIAYESDEGGDREIFVLNKRGRVNVTNHRAADWNPVWSPEGKRLAFESFRDGSRGIYQVFTDTALVSPLAVGAGASWSPTWAPDGEHIAFVSDRDGTDALYILKLRGKSLSQPDIGSGPIAAPRWRPEHGG